MLGESAQRFPTREAVQLATNEASCEGGWEIPNPSLQCLLPVTFELLSSQLADCLRVRDKRVWRVGKTKESDSEEGSCGLIANVVCSSERRDDVTLVTLTFTQRRYSNLCSFLTTTRILNATDCFCDCIQGLKRERENVARHQIFFVQVS